MIPAEVFGTRQTLSAVAEALVLNLRGNAALRGTRPRVHGNGFIQLDLTDRVRLHVWGDSRIPRQRVETPIHDHTFGFTSLVLGGRLRQLSYVVDASGAWRKFVPHRATVRKGEDTVLSPAGDPVSLRPDMMRSQLLTAGGTYSMRPGEIHETLPQGIAVSVIVKDGPSLAQGGSSPTVYVPLGWSPDNDFDRYAAPQDLLWQIIQESLVTVAIR